MYRRIWMATLAVVFAGALAASASSPASRAPHRLPPAASAPTTAPADAPNAAPADAPTAAAADAPTAAAADSPTAAAAPSGATGSARTFTIVPEQTEASYQVQEKFLNRDLPNMALGKTNAVTGELQVSLDGKPSGKVTKITVDLRTLTSDQSRRDNRIRTQWLESRNIRLRNLLRPMPKASPTAIPRARR